MKNYFGVIEDNQDPEKRGRVRVRIYGLHTHDKDVLPTENLLWSHVARPTTESNFGIGSFSIPEQGTVVMGMFMDKHFQKFLVTNVIPVSYDELPDFEKGFTDKDSKFPNSEAMKDYPSDEEETQTKDFGTEPDMDFSTTYPKRKYLYRDETGNEVYIDNSDNNVVRIKHSTGTELHILDDGTFIIKGKKDLYLSAKGKTTINSSGETNVNCDADVYIKGTTINLN